MSDPVFAVVGHPNKGKSSIVATLAQDDSVIISAEPGTTTRCRRFPMKVDDQLLYTLVDTPGFQRARAALAWMKARERSAADRPDIVHSFVDEHRNSNTFPDECELLSPLIQGAGILYVVDGSRPYGDEYEAEMEILRWTGQPSMALINLVGDGNHVEQWTAALGQFFKVVRVFNAVTAEFYKRIDLLTAFGQLKQEWRKPLTQAVASLEHDRERRRGRSAREIAEMLADMLASVFTQRLSTNEDPDPHQSKLSQRYLDGLRERERACRRAVERIYDHRRLKRSEQEFDLVATDLFSKQSWLLWGLTRRQLITAGAIGGALAGGGIDLALGGASLMLGTAIGGAVGTASALFSFDRMIEAKVLGLPLGGQEVRVGPVSNTNFPYVVLGRALYHHALIAGRSHALRAELTVDSAAANKSAAALSVDLRKKLQRIFSTLKPEADAETVADACDELTALVTLLLKESERNN
ncbi:MAG: DUF3482 domain-containing protein [Gammaproteobacteria bacterium]|nr:DUF3482 domain-containing protein [Gammaproteobacteria bacterium]